MIGIDKIGILNLQGCKYSINNETLNLAGGNNNYYKKYIKII